MKVFLCGRDNFGWALDDDYFLTRQALPAQAMFIDSAEEAEIVHAINWRALLSIPSNVLRSRAVIAHVSHDVRAMLGQPDYLRIAPYVTRWIAPSKRAERMLSLLGLSAAYVPYVVDTRIFHPLPDDERRQLRTSLGLPADRYLIGSFQRDTEGHDLASPKLVKGPDVFFEIVRRLHRSGRPIHVVLAGPRRMWLRRKLTSDGIPHTYVGTEHGTGDDLAVNKLDQRTVNELYNAVNLYIVASRLEGGPKAVLECSATGTRIISSDVGQALDVLQPPQVFRNLPQAVRLVEADIDNAKLAGTIEKGLATARALHPESVAPLWEAIYDGLSAPDRSRPASHFRPLPTAPPLHGWRRLLAWMHRSRVCFDYVPRKGPWGGGNQFLNALAAGLSQQGGWRVRFGKDGGCEVVLLNSYHSKLIEQGAAPDKHYVHRIDGPTFLIRGKDIELDEGIFRVNEQVASLSVLQSEWSLLHTLQLGFRPVNPVLIHNAADPAIFYPARTHDPAADRKLRLISTSWSDNPRKGGAIYKWLDDHLDWNRYEYTFVGRVSEPLRNIRVVPPVASPELANILRSHDIYITASDNDPCSNALIEAMSCGLPTIYFNRGGHPELVGFGGLGFEQPEEIPALLDDIESNYGAFRRLAVTSKLANVAQGYAECFALASGRKQQTGC